MFFLLKFTLNSFFLPLIFDALRLSQVIDSSSWFTFCFIVTFYLILLFGFTIVFCSIVSHLIFFPTRLIRFI